MSFRKRLVKPNLSTTPRKLQSNASEKEEFLKTEESKGTSNTNITVSGHTETPVAEVYNRIDNLDSTTSTANGDLNSSIPGNTTQSSVPKKLTKRARLKPTIKGNTSKDNTKDDQSLHTQNEVDCLEKHAKRVHFEQESKQSSIEPHPNISTGGDVVTCSNILQVNQHLNQPLHVETTGSIIRGKKSHEMKPNCQLTSPGSQSEGEADDSSRTLLKKKEFKPNVNAMRRKRLSSFSAYSDDEDRELSSCKEATTKSSKTHEHIPTEGKLDEEASCDSSVGDNGEAVVKKSKKSKSTKIITEEKDVNTLTMSELVYYKPKSLKKIGLKSESQDKDKDTSNVVSEESIVKINEGDSAPQDDGNNNDDEVMAPQIMMNENGEIVINEQSLLVKQKVDDSVLNNCGVVVEDAHTFSSIYRKSGGGKRWSLNETLRFYKALSQIGTDFTLMQNIFPKFTRKELKQKFKREEKVNCDLIDTALSSRLPLDMDIFAIQDNDKDKGIIDEHDNNISLDSS